MAGYLQHFLARLPRSPQHLPDVPVAVVTSQAISARRGGGGWGALSPLPGTHTVLLLLSCSQQQGMGINMGWGRSLGCPVALLWGCKHHGDPPQRLSETQTLLGAEVLALGGETGEGLASGG